jgi:hypothetical protein
MRQTLRLEYDLGMSVICQHLHISTPIYRSDLGHDYGMYADAGQDEYRCYLERRHI